jgi:AraC-like DNA-binding protein
MSGGTFGRSKRCVYRWERDRLSDALTKTEPNARFRTLHVMRSTHLDALRQRCLALIDQHYRDPDVGPIWLARELFVSRRQLDRAFVNCPGVAEILARRRLQQVVALAAHNPTLPMSEIAQACGYGTYETFRAQCHRYLGCSPRGARHAFCTAHHVSEAA